MTAIYDATIFLNIALLAIAVSVFVLAASLLGRALEMSRKDEEDRLALETGETDSVLKSLKGQLEKEKGSEAIATIEKQIDAHKAKQKAREKASHRSRRAFGLLTVRESVVYPGVLFLLSLGFSGWARIAFPDSWSNALWLASLAAAALGVYRLYECLGVIQRVAITSEETQHKRLTAALREALKAHEEGRKPVLSLHFFPGQPPFSVAPNATETTEFQVVLEQGDIARNAVAYFFAPQGFDFPRLTPQTRPSNLSRLPGALQSSVAIGDVHKGVVCRREIEIKAPSEVGAYDLFFCLICEGFAGEFAKFIVKVR